MSYFSPAPRLKRLACSPPPSLLAALRGLKSICKPRHCLEACLHEIPLLAIRETKPLPTGPASTPLAEMWVRFSPSCPPSWERAGSVPWQCHGSHLFWGAALAGSALAHTMHREDCSRHHHYTTSQREIQQNERECGNRTFEAEVKAGKRVSCVHLILLDTYRSSGVDAVKNKLQLYGFSPSAVGHPGPLGAKEIIKQLIWDTALQMTELALGGGELYSELCASKVPLQHHRMPQNAPRSLHSAAL